MIINVKMGYRNLPAGKPLEVPFLISLRGESGSKRKLAIVYVIDVSPSMDGDKIFRAKEGLIEVARKLGGDDMLGIISFCRDIKVEGVFKGSEFIQIEEVIASLKLCPGTNLYEALRAGIKLARELSRDNNIVRVVLITDGEPTVGRKDLESFKKLARSSPVPIVAIGVGTNYNELILNTIGRSSGGYFEHVINSAQLRELLEEQVIKLGEIVALDVSVRVIPTKLVREVKIPYLKTVSFMEDTVVVEVPEVNVKVPQEIVGLLKVSPIGEGGEHRLGECEIRYSDVEGETKVSKIPLVIKVAGEGEPLIEEEEVLLKYNLFSLAEAIEEAVIKGERKRVFELLNALSDATLSLGETELYTTTLDIMEEIKKGKKDVVKRLLSVLSKLRGEV